jgi:hypothetical protein
LSIMLGAGEKRTEPYFNTVMEYRSQQCRRMPKARQSEWLCHLICRAVH